MAVTIRKAESPSDRERVYRFRYDIYVMEMKRAQKYADHAARTIREPFDETGHIFLAEDEEERVVGTVRNNFARDTDLGAYRELYSMAILGAEHQPMISICTKLMLSPEHRRGTLAHRLCTSVYTFALTRNILFDFIDCNPHLEDYFQRLGYRKYQERIHHPEYGDVLPLVLALTDLAHLEEVGSPWARLLRQHFPHHDANDALRKSIQEWEKKEPPQVV
jgi:hypothetical protein